jgi:hypothetical protein
MCWLLLQPLPPLKRPLLPLPMFLLVVEPRILKENGNNNGQSFYDLPYRRRRKSFERLSCAGKLLSLTTF